MEEALVSIIIPLYNAETYLDECLKSIENQTYQNLEILIVDDGSTDSSFEIYKSYSEKIKRIQVIQKKNEGVSKTRNIGINHSKGQYILFVDADDYIEKTYVEKLVQNVKDSDIAVCGFTRIHKEEKTVIYRESGFISKNELFTHTFCSNLIGGTCWNKIFRADIIKKNKLRFDETISIGEDMLFLAEYYRVCSKVTYVSEALYYYRCNPESVLQQSYQKKQFDVHNISCLEAAEKLSKLYENDTEDILECVAYRKVRSSLWLLYQMVFCKYYDRNVLGRIQRIIKHDYSRYSKNSWGTQLEKLTAAGMCIFPCVVYYIGTIMVSGFKEKFKKYLT